MAQKRNINVIDIALGAVITISVLFIGYRLLNSNKQQAAVVAPNRVTPAPVVAVRQTPGRGGLTAGGNFATKLNPVPDAAWTAFIQKSTLATAKTKETPQCAQLPETKTRGFMNPAFIPAIKGGNLRTLFILRRQVCLKVGSDISMLVFDPAPTSPIIQFLGTAKIAELYSLERAKLPDDLFAILGTTREAYLTFADATPFSGETTSKTYETVVRFEALKPADKMPDLPPPGLPKGIVLNREDLAKELAKEPNAILVDVRGEEEFRAGSLPNAINVPFIPTAKVGKTVNWTAKNFELEGSTFNLATLLPNRERRIFVFANDAKDARALYAAITLNTAFFPNIGWVYNGVSGTDKAPQAR